MNFLKGLADKAKSAADALESPTKLGQGIINQPSFQGGSARYILRKRFLDPPTPPINCVHRSYRKCINLN